MRRPPRVFVPSEAWPSGQALRRQAGAVLRLSEETERYLLRVLRLGAGDAVVAFDGSGRQADAVVAFDGTGRQADAVVRFEGGARQVGSAGRLERGRRVVLELREVRQVARPAGPELVLLMGLLKADKMDWVVQKCTELGVDQLWAVTTARSVARPGEARQARRLERLGRIAQEAARQSGRAFVPRLRPAGPLEAALEAVGPPAAGAVLWEGVDPLAGPRLRDLPLLPEESSVPLSPGTPLLSPGSRPLSPGSPPASPGTPPLSPGSPPASPGSPPLSPGSPPLSPGSPHLPRRQFYLLVGPEGGLTRQEVDAARQRGLVPVTLGEAILRAETAAMAAVALLGARLGRLG